MPESQPKQLIFQAVKLATAPAYRVTFPEEFFERLTTLLELDDKRVEILRRTLPNLACAYLSVKGLLKGENPHRSRQAVVRLASSLTDAMTALDDIGIEQTIAVSVLLDRARGASSPQSLIAFRNTVEQVRDAAKRWTDSYKPTDRRPRNRALELHVGGLMCLFEKLTGKRPTAALKRTGSHEPRLTSPGAEAIGSFLLSIDGELTETAIANKVVEIGREFKGRPLDHFAPVLLAGAPGYPVP